MHPLVGGAVLGEQDDPTIIPLTVSLEVGFEPVEDSFGFGVDLILGGLRPRSQFVQHLLLVCRQRLRTT